MSSDQQHYPGGTGSRRKISLGLFLLPTIVIICGVVIATWMMKTGPKAKSKPKVRNAVMVDVRPVEFSAQKTTVSIMGTVKPQREVELKPEVSGKVINLGGQLIPGGFVSKGETLLVIDPRDYELNVRQLENDVARAEADLKLESGNQKVARKEYELLGEEVDEDELPLMLREPQLESAQANLEAARIKLEQAMLDLQRTTVKAPFNAVVISRDINIGTTVSSSTPLATLVGTDSYWIEASIPVSQIKWINPGNSGKPTSLAHVYDTAAWGKQVFRMGKTAGLTGSLEEEGRMARLLIEVPDPLSRSGEAKNLPRLLLGSYVRVEVAGQTLPHATAIERNLVHDGDYVWVMDSDNLLDIRPVEIAFRSVDHVLVTGGLEEGERLVTSNLPSPVQGMELRLANETDTTAGKDSR